MKSEFEKKAKSLINDLNEKIDELLEKSDISKDDIKKEVDVRIKELKKSKAAVEEEYRKIREENLESFEKAETFIKNTTSEIKSAFSDLFSTKKDTDKEETEKPDAGDNT